MSPDPNQPSPDWWQRPQEAKKEPEDQADLDSQATRQYPVNQRRQDPRAGQRYPADQGSQGSQGPQDSQATRQHPVERGRPADQWYAGGQDATADQRYGGGQGGAGQGGQAAGGFAAGQGYQAGQAYPSGPGFPSGPSFQPAGAGYQPGQDYPTAHGSQDPRGTQDYRASQDYPASPGYAPGQGFPPAQGYQATPAAGARRRRRRWPWITLIVIIVVLVGGDRAANAFAEDQMASQFQSSLELSGKPHVTIQGFPFLTQLAAQNLHQVDINASNETAGPGGQLEIAKLNATLHGLHIHGTNSATIDDFTASALVTFTALAHAGNIPGGITLSADGPNRIKAHVDLEIISGDVVAQVTQVGNDKINIKVVDANGLPLDALGNLVNFTVKIPKLPAGVKIQKISITSQGLRLQASGHNTTLTQ